MKVREEERQQDLIVVFDGDQLAEDLFVHNRRRAEKIVYKETLK